MQLHARMRFQKRVDGLRFVRREIVDDDVDLAPARLARDDVGQELHEGGAGVPGTVCPMISPVLVFSAAYRESVPWRWYSNP